MQPPVAPQQQPVGLLNDAPAFGGDSMFPGAAAVEDDGGAGWADGFGEAGFGDTKEYNLDFARASLTEVLSSSTGGKSKKSGLQVNAAINYSAEKK